MEALFMDYSAVGSVYGEGVEDIFAGLEGVGTAGTVISLALGVFMIVALWKLFTKFGEPGWKAIIPFYNIWIEFKYIWGKGAAMFLLLIPVVNLVIAIILCVKEARAFGKGGGFAVGLVFLPIIFVPILAFGDAKYQGAQP